MKRRVKGRSSVYAFLHESGVLDTGTHEEIQSARKAYWKEYKRKWRNEKRRKEKEITVSLDNLELNSLSLEARRHKITRTQFLKLAAFAYINRSFIVPDKVEVRQIEQLLSMTYNSIQDLLENDAMSFNVGRDALATIRKLELDILPTLHHPKLMEEYLMEHIQKHPDSRSKLLKIINSL